MTNQNRGRPKNERDLVRISTHIPRSHYELLREISVDEDLSTGQIIRRALELYLISQRDVLNITDSDLTIATHLTETRSRKAIKLSHIDRLQPHSSEPEDALAIFEELNPDAF